MPKEVAVVFGGTGAIGSAIARRLVQDGFVVVTSSRHGGTSPAQVTSDDDVRATLRYAENPTVLVNSFCDTPPNGPSLDLAPEELRQNLVVDVEGLFRTCREFARYAIPRGYGRIINISSIAAFAHPPERASYSAAKGAVISLTRALAVEWAPHGVTVNAVLPALTDSPMGLRNVRDHDHLEAIKKRFPTRRLVLPSDIAHAVSFLASPLSSQINGISLVVDGGWTLT